MSDSSVPHNNNKGQFSIVKEVYPPFLGTPQDLAKYTATTSNNFLSRTQQSGIVPQPTFLAQPSVAAQYNHPPKTSASPATQNSKPISSFAASAYEAAGYKEGYPINNIPAKNFKPKLLPPLTPQQIDSSSFKGLKFVALDSLQIETRDIYDKISGTFQWEVCGNDVNFCISYIENECKNKRTFLVSTGSLGKEVIPKIHELPQLYAIYIFCGDVIQNQSWAHKFTKVRVVCNDDDTYLLPQLAIDVAQANIDWGNALLTAGNKETAQKKFKKALENLVDYAKVPDENMIKQVQSLIEQCK